MQKIIPNQQQRTLIKQILGIILITALLAPSFTRPDEAVACTAPVGGLDPFVIKDHVNASDMVFLGKVVSYHEYPPSQTSSTPSSQPYIYYVTVEVTNYFKGTGGEVASIATFGTSALCLQGVSLNESYLFFGNPDTSYEEVDFRATYLLTQQAVKEPTQENIEEVIAAVNGDYLYQFYLPIVQHAETSETTPLFGNFALFKNWFNH